MNNEIKEKIKAYYISNDIDKILDYITNLQTIEKEYCAVLSENAELENNNQAMQEENDKLKAELEMYENGVYFSSENDKLQERIDTELLLEIKDKDTEIERLNNIINELEKYLNEQIQKSWEIEEQCYEDIENKLQELKGDSSNDK